MAKNIEPKLRKIGDYLKLDNDAMFIIPEYQRAYSWSIGNCDKLWQDINDFAFSDSKDRYFFGTIIINCQDNDTKYGLIDGQQRTTTFLLLLKALLIAVNNAIGQTANDTDSVSLCNGLKERRRRIMGILYKAEPEDISEIPEIQKDYSIYLQVNLLQNYSINEQYKTELITILKSIDYVDAERNVVKIAYKQKDNKYTNFFRNFKYFCEKINDLSPSQLNTICKTITDNCEVIEIKSWQVEQAITMFNSLNSDGMPLSDSDIISAKLYAIAEKNNQGIEFTKLWKELLDQINEIKELNMVSIESILTQYMYFVRAYNKEVLSETGSVDVTVPGVRRYYTELNKDLIEKPIDTCLNLLHLAKTWKRVVTCPELKLLLKFNENAKLFLGIYFFRQNSIDEEKFKKVVETMLRLFVILELVDSGYSSKNFKTFLFKESVKLMDDNVKIEEIMNDFSNHIQQNWNQEDVKLKIKDYDKHTLVFLNEYLFAKEKNIEFTFDTKCDIEHIMPASGNNLSEIRKDANISSEDEFRAIVNKLGNKILLEDKINRSIGNEWFRTKTSTKLEEKTGYVSSAYPIASYLVKAYQNIEKPLWTKEDIEQATERASQRIVDFIFDA
ncbi:MAG: DUF262 domain-containing protein [Clostridia bacterium]|nr:DUF262 domain-containing protein [Clostridia bacterium]